MIDQFIIISGIILYYLYRPHVMAYFGKVGRILVLLAADWKELRHFLSFSTRIHGFLLLVAILCYKPVWLFSEPSKEKCLGRRVFSFRNFFRNTTDTVF